MAEFLIPSVRGTDPVPPADHGVVTFGATLEGAFYRMKRVEDAAPVTFPARVLGGEMHLAKRHLEGLRSVNELRCEDP